MIQRIIPFGIIGGGMMGREFASAAARWFHLTDLDFRPKIVAVCDHNPPKLAWFESNLPSVRFTTTDYRQLLDDPQIEAVYVAVPHYQHQSVYTDVLKAGKHLLGEKPFGIDLTANQVILQEIKDHPSLLARCCSQFPFYPGAYRIYQWFQEGRFGSIIDVEAGFWHSSDLDPNKPINWKRRLSTNGEYGCMGDLGLHILHLPLRFSWMPTNLRAILSKIVSERPDGKGNLVPCETWDNALLACETITTDQHFPLILSIRRIAPGQANTWYLRISGTSWSAEFTTRNPKQVRYLTYTPGGSQEWRILETAYQTAYATITGSIFEFGFSDAILQMWAAYCDELVHGAEGMVQYGSLQPLRCALPEETARSHQLFTAALESQRTGNTITLRV